MKKNSRIISFIIALITIFSIGFSPVNAQSPQAFKYQAVARDLAGNVLPDQAVAFRMSILQGSSSGFVVYSERHALTTNEFGLANLSIGNGTVLEGSFPEINWGSNTYFIKTEIDPAGGTTYQEMGTSQFLSVPYSLYSENSGQTFTAGTGIDVTGNTISNTAPDQAITLTGTGATTVTGTYPGFTINTPAAVPYTGGTGINVSGSTITNTAPDQTVVLNSGTGINTTGIYPNFTIANSAPDQTVVLTSGAGINTTGTYPNFTVANSAPNATHTGDATGNTALTVVKIQGQAVSSTAPAANQVLQWNGTQWAPSSLSAPSSGWLLSGNGGTNPTSNFLGTSDNVPLIFRVNNQKAGQIDPLTSNTSLGYKALLNNSTGHSNVAFGTHALFQNTSRSNLVAIGDSALYNNGVGATGVNEATGNTAVGSKAMYANTTGYANTAIGSNALIANINGKGNTANGVASLAINTAGNYNTANGVNSLLSNNTGNRNTATGGYALFSNTTGNDNTANGVSALQSNTTGHSNVAVGVSALNNNTTRSNLVAIGDSALYKNGVGATGANEATGNTAVGSKALFANTKGYANTATGSNALNANINGEGNTADGNGALLYNTTGSYNTANGLNSLRYNTGGYQNTATGVNALYFNTTGCNNTANGSNSLLSNTGGHSNVAYGASALYTNTTCSNLVAIGDSALYYNGWGASEGLAIGNTAVGSKALYANTTGSYNTATGISALYSNTDGFQNTATGMNALYFNTTGCANTANGLFALFFNTTGNENAANGAGALLYNTTGSWNTAIGVNALSNNTSGTHNTCLGWNANVSAGNLDDANSLGCYAIVNEGVKTRIGDVWQEVIEGQALWSTPTDGRFKTNITEDVKGLVFIKRLRPVTYNDESRKFLEFLVKSMPDSVQQRYLSDDRHPAVNPIRQTGFIAQEVEMAAKAVGYDFNGVHIPEDGNGNYSIAYAAFVVPLVKAVQEQQVMIEELQKEIEALKNKLEKAK